MFGDDRTLEFIPLDKIDLRQSPQVRVKTDNATVDYYLERLEAGDVFPPIVVFWWEDKGVYLIGDGRHRYLTHEKAKHPEIYCEVRIGDIHDCVRYALSANSKHGLPRTREDKRLAVCIALNDSELSRLSTAELSRRLMVSQGLISSIRSPAKPPTTKREESADSLGEEVGLEQPLICEPDHPETTEEGDTVLGIDGKSYPAKLPKKPKKKGGDGSEICGPDWVKDVNLHLGALIRLIDKNPRVRGLVQCELDSLAQKLSPHLRMTKEVD